MLKRTTSELVLLAISAFAVITISPFIYLRYLDEDYFMVALDAGIVVSMFLFFVFTFKTRKAEIAKLVFAILVTCVIILIIVLRGQSHIYWIYPAIIAIYYILPEKAAVTICVFAISIILFVLFPSVNVIEFFTIMMTFILTLLFTYVIFSNYNKTNERLALLATIDPLTSCGNRRALDTSLQAILSAQKRESKTVSLILLDLDHFKKINDNHSHSVGDQVLIDLVQLMNKHTRALDTIFRYGGEEFIIAPLALDLSSATQMAEKLRVLIEKYRFVNNIQATVSIGVAQYRTEESAEAWISRADAALYKAKNSGRNQVINESDNT